MKKQDLEKQSKIISASVDENLNTVFRNMIYKEFYPTNNYESFIETKQNMHYSPNFIKTSVKNKTDLSDAKLGVIIADQLKVSTKKFKQTKSIFDWYDEDNDSDWEYYWCYDIDSLSDNQIHCILVQGRINMPCCCGGRDNEIYVLICANTYDELMEQLRVCYEREPDVPVTD